MPSHRGLGFQPKNLRTQTFYQMNDEQSSATHLGGEEPEVKKKKKVTNSPVFFLFFFKDKNPSVLKNKCFSIFLTAFGQFPVSLNDHF